jgi:hypothetical protein
VEKIVSQTNQAVLAKIAILPSIMFGCFVALGLYFRQRGGYREIVLVRPRSPALPPVVVRKCTDGTDPGR